MMHSSHQLILCRPRISSSLKQQTVLTHHWPPSGCTEIKVTLTFISRCNPALFSSNIFLWADSLLLLYLLLFRTLHTRRAHGCCVSGEPVSPETVSLAQARAPQSRKQSTSWSRMWQKHPSSVFEQHEGLPLATHNVFYLWSAFTSDHHHFYWGYDSSIAGQFFN